MRIDLRKFFEAYEGKPHQLSAIDNLLEAYERFADFKSLIEVAYQTQSKQDRDFSSARNLPLSLQSEIADALGKIQIQNLGHDPALQNLDSRFNLPAATGSSVDRETCRVKSRRIGLEAVCFTSQGVVRRIAPTRTVRLRQWITGHK